jgi:hypothetical protein
MDYFFTVFLFCRDDYNAVVNDMKNSKSRERYAKLKAKNMLATSEDNDDFYR